MSPENRDLFLQTSRELKAEGWEAVIKHMSALLCAKNIESTDGRVFLQTSAHYVRELERAGVSKDRICIKIPATGPALKASPILNKEGIRTLGTSITCVAQDIAASQAGCLSISPCFNLPWYHTDPKQWPDVDDLAMEHRMSARMVQIAQAYQDLKEATGRMQPLLKPASFRSAREVMAMGELGCQHATVSENVSMMDYHSNPPTNTNFCKGNGIPGPRFIHLGNTDPLSGSDWDGKFASIDIDYLANGGAALSKAIAEDPTTKRALPEALNAFIDADLESKRAIEEVLTQV